MAALSYVVRSIAMGRASIQGTLPKFLKRFIVSEVIVTETGHRA
jgi:hypothetical protein